MTVESKSKPPATKAQTRKWVRNKADEAAMKAGMVFEEKRALFVVAWIEDYLRLYEGEHAGEPVTLQDWQYEATMRMFGWVRCSEKYKRWIRRFRSASFWVPKKNKKSPTIAAWAIYLFCGDGEKGQKVFFCAKDGSQAREIAGKHAMEMIKSSPTLLSECKINHTTAEIEHLPTRSTLKPLSSGDERTQKSKEGLNGSTVTDETHVVDRKFKNRISRAGISRSEPLDIEASTAGDDPTSYGKERWDYGEKVNTGEIENLYHLHISYHAPQDVSDADLAADPIKYGKMANPAWGHTIDPEEFLVDYKSSLQSASALALFKMYRLNIWQSSATPWLNMDKWRVCGRGKELLELMKGRECWGGLDLSKTTDSTAFSLCFPPDDFEGDYTILTWFWLPRETARAFNHLVPWMDWAKQNHLSLNDGDVIDYSEIRDSINAICKEYEVRVIYFDQYQAASFVQRLQQEDGINCEEFAQTMMNFAEPTKEFERLTLEERIAHPSNPVMDWQVSVTSIKSDANGNMRPIKPNPKGHKKIDGPVSAIMALAGGLTADGGGSFYDEHEVESG